MTKVYFFQKYDIASDTMIRSKRPATLERIWRVEGEPLMDTVQEIPESDVDGDGFQKRKP
jgi:hypothetical protein